MVSKSSRKDDAMLTWVGASREGVTNFLFFENLKSFDRWSKRSIYKGTVEFSSEIAIPPKFTAEHTETAKAPESINNDWNRLKTLRTLRSPR